MTVAADPPAPALPIHAVIGELLAALSARNAAVLVAPPGAGKTTSVAPALLDQSWCNGTVLLTSPRRLAARAAAERMAHLLGEPVGETIGYATRLDSRQSAATRVLIVTEGILRNRIIADPALDGVSAILFDEVHERSLDGDFGLALAIEAQGAFRPDLRLLAMSATLDGARFSALLGDAPVIESAGRMHPLTLHHIGRDASLRIEADMARAIRRALAEEGEGDVLAFLPGVREIERTAEALAGVAAAVVPLHGSLEPAAQRAAISRKPGQGRKVILATSIAETSVTVDGVRIVVDSGLARRPRFDPAAGVARLVTERESLAAATQRAGRAARQRPGVAYRLWAEAAAGGMPAFDPPEIMEADLAPLLLDCAAWGEGDPTRLPWLDPPPAPALAEARKRLIAMAALDGEGRLTERGAAIARLPLPPALANMLLIAGAHGAAPLAADVAVLLSERGLGGPDADIERRLSRWRGDRGQRAEAARGLARRWAALAGGKGRGDGLSVAALVALAYPERLSRRRSTNGDDWLSVGGRGYRLDSESALAGAQWLAIADVQGAAGGARILSAAAIGAAEVEALFADRIEERRSLRYDRAADRVDCAREVRLEAIVLRRGHDEAVPASERAALLLDVVAQEGLGVLPWSDTSLALRQRAAFAGLEALGDAALLASLGEWLAPVLANARRLSTIDSGRMQDALLNRLTWDERQRLEANAPAEFRSPAGSHHSIDYGAEGGPTVTVRVQAVFGLDRHPMVGQPPVPLILSLTSPAGRPIQTTRDLPSFWRGSWAAVAKEMRGRYPKHPWPDDPAAAPATLRTKAADARSRSGG